MGNTEITLVESGKALKRVDIDGILGYKRLPTNTFEEAGERQIRTLLDHSETFENFQMVEGNKNNLFNSMFCIQK